MPLILIVDDFPDGRDVMALVLRHAGYSVLTAASGTEALRVAQDARPDLVLLDFRMPDMTGFEVLESLRGASPNLPVIMMTALFEQTAIDEATRLGARDYLVKGNFDIDDMLTRIARQIPAQVAPGAAAPATPA
jgi:two-component system OmpR family response regulator